MTININNSILINDIEYIKVCMSNDVCEGKGKQIIFEGDDDFQIAVFRIKGKLYALNNICPHRHADRIFEGFIKDMTVMCPLHGWTYSIETGQNVNLKQGIKSLISYPIMEANGLVYVEKPDFEIPKWRR